MMPNPNPNPDPQVEELKRSIQQIVSECTSEQELARRLASELGITSSCISWRVPDSVVALEALRVGVAVGGLVSKNGAMVMIMCNAPQSGMIRV